MEPFTYIPLISKKYTFTDIIVLDKQIDFNKDNKFITCSDFIELEIKSSKMGFNDNTNNLPYNILTQEKIHNKKISQCRKEIESNREHICSTVDVNDITGDQVVLCDKEIKQQIAQSYLINHEDKKICNTTKGLFFDDCTTITPLSDYKIRNISILPKCNPDNRLTNQLLCHTTDFNFDKYMLLTINDEVEFVLHNTNQKGFRSIYFKIITDVQTLKDSYTR